MATIIRSEEAGDGDAIHALTKAAFENAPHTGGNEQFILDSLRNAGALVISLVAEKAGTLVGHVAISPVIISNGEQGWFGLGPISVAPQHQGQGIGSLLMNAALNQLRAQGANGCVVLGDPRFYGRFGFRPEPGLVLPGVHTENFQAVAFRPRRPAGAVTYHHAFTVPGGDLKRRRP